VFCVCVLFLFVLSRPHAYKKLEPHRYTLDITLHYAGELEVTIVAIVGAGGVKAKVPVTVKDVQGNCVMCG
jgi:hypothetical protein